MTKPYHKNPRQITGKQYEQLKDWLLELGDLSGIVHDLNSDEIIGGNQRSAVFDLDDCTIEITEQLDAPDKQGTVAHGFVVWRGHRYAYRQVRWTERQCEKANIVANRAGGAWDFDVLANEFDIDDLFSWGFDPIDFGLDEPEEEADPQDAAPQVDRAEELREEWGVELGQMWRLPARDGSGEHRIICGDCTDADVVARVMDGDTLRMVWTDPPYGVSYGAKNRFLQTIGRSDRLEEDIAGDDGKPEDVRQLVADSLSGMAAYSSPGAVAYVASPPGTLLPYFIEGMNISGFQFKHQLVWVKNQQVFGRADYMYKHESILYGWIHNGAHQFEPRVHNNSVFEVDRPRESKLHPTMKPIELLGFMIPNSSEEKECVGEPFSGSGTTIIACENLNRYCRAIEISPAYVAVALQRYVDAFGVQPELITADQPADAEPQPVPA